MRRTRLLALLLDVLVCAAPADAAVARVVGTENVLQVRVEARRDGLAFVRAGAVELVAIDPGGLAREAFACIRAEEIVLEEAPGAPTSARRSPRPST